MAKRKGISASVRWHVFARDGFMCRYCGTQAGDDGAELVVDHAVSVADGGTNNIDNLVAACRACNGGKSARSVGAVPTPDDLAKRMRKLRKTLETQAAEAAAIVAAKRALEQQIVNMKGDAYNIAIGQTVRFQQSERATVRNLIHEFGFDTVADWYNRAASKGVNDWQAIRYVCGIARMVRKDRADG